MTIKATLRSLDEVAAHLPFHVDDVGAANAAFLRWHTSGAAEDLRIVELWTYCYTRHYFIVKFLRDSAYGPTDLDTLVSKSFVRIRDNFDRVSDPERFASWASVICRNTFINFLRRHRERFSLDTSGAPQESVVLHGEHDGLLARRAVEEAIGGLRPHLQEIARLRFLEGHPYHHISAVTGRPLATVRAYAHRAASELRDFPAIRVLFEELSS